MNPNEITFFSLFLLFVLCILFFDLKLVGKNTHIIKFREATFWTSVWVMLAIVFYYILRLHGDWIHGIDNLNDLKEVIVRFHHPVNIDGLSTEQALKAYRDNLSLEYITGYLIEYSLSVDNVFVMILIFSAFGVESRYYKRVLFWGILGAIIMRFIFIFLSATLIQRFEWILYIFGGFLLITGFQMFRERNRPKKVDPTHHPVVRFTSKYFRVSKEFHGHHFWIREGGKWMMTPLFIVLLIIEFTDVIFAVDSVPAIFSVTKDPYIVFFSNIFAIMGLRSLFFLVSNIMDRFIYLKHGLSILLMFIGVKMLLPLVADIHISTQLSLLIISAILAISILASFLFPKTNQAK